jgi:DNA ligase D-like protein (predicted polymerase)
VAEAIELTVGGRAVRVTNPDRPYFPESGTTKLDVVRYFVAVGDGLLEAVRDRPTALERWPRGVFPGAKLATWLGAKGDAFFQKRIPDSGPAWVQRAVIDTPEGPYAAGLYATEVAVLAWAANQGTLRFHPWAARRPDLEHPDLLRLDLDPQAGRGFRDAVRVGRELRGLLGEHGLTGFPKTSGGRGLHVLVPIEPRWTSTEVRRAVIALGRELVRRMPDDATIEWWKEQRGERVFLDYNQVGSDRTVTAAYSVRPAPGARVSAPVTWEELETAEPEDFDVTTMPARFAALGDLHAGLAERPCSLEPLLERAARDERDGLGELPYPPRFPKMPGEPKRVQPSRARADA